MNQAQQQSVSYLIASTKYHILITFTSITAALLALYGIINILHNIAWAGYIELAISLLLFTCLGCTLKRRKVEFATNLLLVTLEIMAIFLFKSGGIMGTGIHWLFIPPIAYFFFKGAKEGMIWFLVQIALMLLFILLAHLEVLSIAFSQDTSLVCALVLITESAMLYSHEKILFRYTREVKILQGLLPICAACKKIKDDEGYWNHLEQYIGSHSQANFSHGMCPACIKEYYPNSKIGEDRND